MPNNHVPAAGEAMPAAEGMKIITGRFSRRILLGALAAVPAGAALAKPPKAFPCFGSPTAEPAEPVTPPTPDERISAAIEEIKAAFWQKWPDAPIRILETDNSESGVIMVVSHVSGDKPGAVSHLRNGVARRPTGGVS